ncbi:cupin, partial [Micromonospora sp. CPCC 205543]
RLRARAWPAARPAPIRPLAQAAALATLDADAHIAPRGGLRWQLTATGDRVALRLTDRTITLPATCEAALRALLTGAVTRVGDLPGLDDDADRLVLARRLLREAVAVPA